MIKERDEIVRLLSALFPNVKVYLFGSRAGKDYKPTSDIDIALDTGSRLSIFEVAKAKNVLEALYIPQKIDIVDIHAVPEHMKTLILNEGIVWKD